MEQIVAQSSNTNTPLFLQGGGEMGRRIREFEWAQTSLGSVEGWPQSLRSAVSICLNSNFPIAIYWGEALTLLYNDAWSPIPGNKHPWSLGKAAREVWPDIWDNIEPQFQKAFNGEPGGSKDALLPMRRHGYTEECYFDFTFTPVYGETGKVEGIFNAVIETTYRIISERRTAFLKNLALCVAQTKTEGQLFEEVIDCVKDIAQDISFAFLYTAKEGSIELLDSSVLDYPIEQYQKKGWPFENVDSKPLLIETISEYLEAAPKHYWPEEVAEAAIIPIVGTSGINIGFIVCGLSARRRFDADYGFFLESFGSTILTALNNITALEEERKKADALAEIDRAKTRFFTNISHEFRTPLTLMLGSLENLLNDGGAALNDENKQSVELGHRNALRLLRLVNNLLDFSRLEAGKTAAKFRLVDIAAFTKSLISQFRSAIDGAGLKLHLQLDDISQQVYVDTGMWEKIVLNLLSNAFKYTLEGSITVRLSQKESAVILEVTDTGLGIPAKELPKMFERFHRVENTAGRTIEGTGIGLSLVKELVQFHSGNVSVSSQEGKGTTFIVSIPTGNKHIRPEQIYPSGTEESNHTNMDAFVEETTLFANRQSAPQGGMLQHSATVLVVDDNPDMQDYVTGLLQKNFNVVTAGNGEEALQKLKEYKVDLVLSDIMMPVMDGIALLKTIKSNPRTESLPVVLLSARAGEEAKADGFDIGADDYLVKPFSAIELMARVRSQISIARKRANVLTDIYRMFDEVPFAIAALKGPDLVIDYINQHNLEIWQRTKDEVIGLPLFEARPDIRASAEAIHQTVYRTGRRFEAKEIPIVLVRNGVEESLYFDTIIDPMRDETGRIIGQLATSIDVTEKVYARRKIEENEARLHGAAKMLEVKVKERTAELSRSNEDLQQFAHIASHDLKEPIRKILTFAKLLETTDGQGLSAPGKASLNKVFSSGERMMNMINGVLAYAKLAATEQSWEPVDVGQTISNAEADLEVLIRQKEATIIKNDLPRITGAPVLIHQLFYNLINNALKFSKTDVPPVITISSEPGTDNMATIAVSDNGIGFEQEYADRIFMSFTRLNSKDRYEGTGLGLSLCRKIAERHGGTITAEGTPDVGAKFIITLPLA